ncbi:HD domain-containing protein [Sorangium sp. So ce302]|uniref:HD domain-containing protein n=1 Tax=Sorangium sp. So ce302 TaxID=3133297 RepID=UPI003F614EB9
MFPASRDDARSLLATLGAPPHLLRHVELVGEAADLLIVLFREQGIPIDEDLVRVGVVLHDAGKIEHPRELTGPGSEHEPAGERMLLAASVTPALARVCLSHARWQQMACTLEELIIALADKLWKGVRVPDLEERVLLEAAARGGRDRWGLFIPFDSCFERIAERGHVRLERSRHTR